MPEMDIKFYVWARPPGNTVSDPVVPIDPLWYNPMFVPLVKVWLRNVNQINGRPPDSDRFDTGPTDSIERVVIRLQEWWAYLFGDPITDPTHTHIYPNENRPVALFLPNWGTRQSGTVVKALMRNTGDQVGAGTDEITDANLESRVGVIYSEMGAQESSTYTDDLLDEWDANGPKELRIETLLWDLEQGINIDRVFVKAHDYDPPGPQNVPQGWRYWAVNDDRYDDQVILDDVGASAPRTLQQVGWVESAKPTLPRTITPCARIPTGLNADLHSRLQSPDFPR